MRARESRGSKPELDQEGLGRGNGGDRQCHLRTHLAQKCGGPRGWEQTRQGLDAGVGLADFILQARGYKPVATEQL